MVLRHIDLELNLDYFYFEKECNIRSLRVRERDFSFQTRCMCAMVERLMGKINTISCSSIVFQCYPDNIPEEYFRSCYQLDGCFFYPILFDIEKFEKADDNEKKRITIETIRKSIIDAGAFVGLSDEHMTDIVSSCDLVADSEYRNEYLWKHAYQFHNYYIQYKIVHEVGYTDIFILLMNRKKEILDEHFVIKTRPDELFFHHYLVKPEIISDSEIRITPKDGDEAIVIRLIDEPQTKNKNNDDFEKKVPKEKVEYNVKLKDPHSTLQFQFFWDTMDLCDWKFEGNDEKVLKPVKKYLSELDDEKIFEFDDMMTELLYHLDRRELAKACEEITGYFSEDDFLYSRCVALINGPRYYSRVLNGVEKHPWSNEFESILYLPQKAWAAKHRKSADKYPHSASLSYETGSNTGGWEE